MGIYFNKTIKTDLDYKYLVFSGGGLKGVSFIGALLILNKLNILYDQEGRSKILGYCGVSVGSLIASILAIGYHPEEIIKILTELDFNKIMDSSTEDLNSGDYIYELLGGIIANKTGNPNYTFNNLFVDKDIRLIIPVTDVLNSKSVRIGPDSNIPIRIAVKMSMAIPMVFKPVEYNDGLYIDGGVFDYYPIDVFDDISDGGVLGFKINSISHPYDSLEDVTHNLLTFSLKCIDLLLISNAEKKLSVKDLERTVVINMNGISIKDFNLTDDKKLEFIRSGSEACKEFFEDKKKIICLDEYELDE